MPNANFNALRVRGQQLALKAFKRIRLQDPVISRGFFTDTRNGYRFGLNEKRGPNMDTALNRLGTISIGNRYGTDFIFDPDDTGKIWLVVQVHWTDLRAAATDDDAEMACRLIYMRKVNVIRLEQEVRLGGLGNPMAFLARWGRAIANDGRMTVINNETELNRAV